MFATANSGPRRKSTGRDGHPRRDVPNCGPRPRPHREVVLRSGPAHPGRPDHHPAVFAGILCLSCLIVLPASAAGCAAGPRGGPQSQSQDHLHNIVLAMHNYESSFKGFLREACLRRRCRASWLGTLLLPYVEQRTVLVAGRRAHPLADPAIGSTSSIRGPQYLNGSATPDTVPMACRQSLCGESMSALRIRTYASLTFLTASNDAGRRDRGLPCLGSCHNDRDLRGLGSPARVWSPSLRMPDRHGGWKVHSSRVRRREHPSRLATPNGSEVIRLREV
jgi:hypothetical protein